MTPRAASYMQGNVVEGMVQMGVGSRAQGRVVGVQGTSGVPALTWEGAWVGAQGLGYTHPDCCFLDNIRPARAGISGVLTPLAPQTLK